jgi:prophage regulatory protein
MTTLIKLSRVIAKTTLTKPSIYRAIREKTFPSPVKTGVRSSAWDEAQIDAWIERRIAESAEASIAGAEQIAKAAAASVRARKARRLHDVRQEPT